MILHKDSHTDLIPKDVLEFILAYYSGCTRPFTETIELPMKFSTVECGLYGPAMGDPPMYEADVFYSRRPNRKWESRLVNSPMRQTRQLTVVAGPYDGQPCVLFTVYGGPATPLEPGDPKADRTESWGFWAHHALSGAR